MTNSLHRNDKLDTVHNKCSKNHSEALCTLLVVCDDSVLFS
jgi:hypothetical protein